MNILELIKIIVLGFVEGITEWLPISSTGHMILLDEFIKLNISYEFKEMFFVVIQLGAIMAVVVLYFKKIFPFSIGKKNLIDKKIFNLWFKIVVACLPAAVIGLLFDDKIDALFYNYQTVSVMLIIYGVLFIIVERRNKNRYIHIQQLEDISYKTALAIGFFQVLALIPGTSRSGATIIGAMILGTSRTVAAEFTFFLAIPVMFGASLLKLIKFGIVFTTKEITMLIVGMIVAFIVSILAIKFLMSYIKHHDFRIFGWYRIILGIVVIIYFFIG